MTALIGFIRELCSELNSRADAATECITDNTTLEGRNSMTCAAVVLKEIALAIEAAAKRTLLA